MAKKQEMTRRNITTEETSIIAEHLFAKAHARLGIPEEIGINRGQWLDALPDITRALKLTEGTPKKRTPRKKAEQGQGPGPDSDEATPADPAWESDAGEDTDGARAIE